ncbi:MAG: MATE family efflux transporter [Bacteroidales bacterium]
MTENKDNQLLQGGVTKSLVSFTIPILFALLLQVMYGAIDMFIVGNFAQISDVSGVSTGSQIIHTLTTLCIGLAMGTTILIGQKIGEKKDSEVGSIISNSIMLFISIAVVIMVLMLIFIENIVTLMNTPSEAIIQTTNYIRYSAMGVPMIFAYNILGSIFRGLGDSKTPLMAVAIACVANVIGDLILVAYCGMGAAGAAIATVMAQSISVVISLYIIRKKALFKYQFDNNIFKINKGYIKRIIILGTPIALQSVLTSLSFLFVLLLVNKFGVIFSAAVGVTEKLICLIMIIPIGFMHSISVFVAQNYGARNFTRSKRGMCVGITISLIYGLFSFYLSIFHGDILIGMFTNDIQIIETARGYLNAYAIDTIMVAFLFCLTGYLNGCGETFYVMIQGIVGAVFIRLILAYLLSMVEPVSLFRIGLATPIASTVQVVMCLIFFVIIEKRRKREDFI